MAKITKKSVKTTKEIKNTTNFKKILGFLPKFSSNLTSDQTKERISTLRTEISQSINFSTSTSILALLLFIGAPSVFPEIINPYLPSSLKIMQGIVVVPSVFWILTILGNMARSIMIFRLQKRLSFK